MKKQLIRAELKTKNGKLIHGYREVYVDSQKNLAYVDKRKQLAERATAELGVTCFG